MFGLLSFLLLVGIAYMLWRIMDQLPDIVFRLSEIQRDMAEVRRNLQPPAAPTSEGQKRTAGTTVNRNTDPDARTLSVTEAAPASGSESGAPARPLAPDTPSEQLPFTPDWRIWLGVVVTAGWLLLGILYVGSSIGWSRIGDQPAEVIGNFLEGAFAPLAFLWLVIGYFLQQKELAQNTEALRQQFREIQRTAEQAVKQTETISAQERHARQQIFLQVHELVRPAARRHRRPALHQLAGRRGRRPEGQRRGGGRTLESVQPG